MGRNKLSSSLLSTSSSILPASRFHQPSITNRRTAILSWSDYLRRNKNYFNSLLSSSVPSKLAKKPLPYLPILSKYYNGSVPVVITLPSYHINEFIESRNKYMENDNQRKISPKIMQPTSSYKYTTKKKLV